MYDTLVLSGGGINGLIMLGCIQYIQDSSNNCVENINTFIGTSVGSIVCYLLCIGYKPIEILIYLLTNNIFEKIKDVNIRGIVTSDGVLSYSKLQETLETITIDKIGFLPTLGDIKQKYGKTLRIITYNETKETEEIQDCNLNSSLPCLTAIRMSCNIPFIFSRFKYGDSFYIDGGVTNHFPINLISDDSDGRSLGIVSIPDRQKFDNYSVNSVGYLLNLLYIPVKHIINKNIDKVIDKKVDVVKISPNENILGNFSIPTARIMDMFTRGYNVMKKYHAEKS